MAYRAVEIANEFLRQPGALGQLTQMQLQKLAYFANGWNWARNGEQLIGDTAEAWDYGPVYRDLYEHTKYFGKDPLHALIKPEDSEAAHVFGVARGRSAPFGATLSEAENAVVADVWKRYGGMSASQLSALTHELRAPWFDAYRKHGRSAPIGQDSIKRYFDELAQRAQHNAAA